LGKVVLRRPRAIPGGHHDGQPRELGLPGPSGGRLSIVVHTDLDQGHVAPVRQVLGVVLHQLGSSRLAGGSPTGAVIEEVAPRDVAEVYRLEGPLDHLDRPSQELLSNFLLGEKGARGTAGTWEARRFS
jgi:hypothetical protein